MASRNSENLVEIVRRITKAKNENDSKTLFELFDPNFVAHIAGYPHTINREEYIKAIECSHKSFSNFAYMIEDIMTESPKVAVRILARGMHTGDYQGHEASHHEVKFQGIIMKRIENGKVVEEWQVNDNLSLLRQIGLSVNHII